MNTPTEIKDKLLEIYNVKTVTGSENSALGYISSQLSTFCDDVFSDDSGNVYAVKKSGSDNAKKIAVVCPFDEAGFIVTGVDDKSARLFVMGGENLNAFYGKKASVFEKNIDGIILSDKKRDEKLSASDFYLETGNGSSADEGICEGDFVTVCDSPVFLGEKRVALCGLSKKAHAAGIIDLIKYTSDFSFDVTFVFTVSGLARNRGEACAAYLCNADIAVCLDVIPDKGCTVGKGPVISFSDSGGKCSRQVVKSLENAAKNIGIGYQMKADFDKDRHSVILPFVANGTKTAIVSVCAEKLESGVGICDLADLRGASALVCAYLIFEEENIGE